MNECQNIRKHTVICTVAAVALVFNLPLVLWNLMKQKRHKPVKYTLDNIIYGIFIAYILSEIVTKVDTWLVICKANYQWQGDTAVYKKYILICTFL